MADELSEMISLRLSAEDKARLDALSERLPAMKPLSIARMALRLGLDVIEKDPLALLTGTASNRPRRQKTSRKARR